MNLLRLALKATGTQKVQYYAVTSITENAAGYLVPSHAPPVTIFGQFQPVATTYYEQLGLDYSKTYANWYDPNSTVRDIDRDTTGDKIVFCGHTYEALSNNDWSCVDGWAGTMFVRIKG